MSLHVGVKGIQMKMITLQNGLSSSSVSANRKKKIKEE